jgi:hypothetical protein
VMTNQMTMSIAVSRRFFFQYSTCLAVSSIASSLRVLGCFPG